MMEGRRAA